MIPLRQRLGLMAKQAHAEQNNFVETALREAMAALDNYDVRVTGLLEANSKVVEGRREMQAQRDAYFQLLWLIVNATGTLTIPRQDQLDFPTTRAELVIEENKATKDVVIVARTRAEKAGAA